MNRHHLLYGMLALCLVAVGCHDGPMYALKAANPVFRSQWAADEKLGITDTTRREALEELVSALPNLSPADQAKWQDDLLAIMENDPSPHHRFLAVRAGAGISGEPGLEVLSKGLQDEASKVRICACQELAKRREPQATELLTKTVGNESDSDVRLSAVAALSGHKGEQVRVALRGALESQDPAFQLAAMRSLKTVTGANLPPNAEAWVAYLDGNPSDKKPGFADRLKNMF